MMRNIKIILMMRLSVPPKPETILEGFSSLKLGKRAPSPTDIPESPMQMIIIVPAWKSSHELGVRSIISEATISISLITIEPIAENKNFPQRILVLEMGLKPSIQKFFPSRLMRGKTNLLVNVASVKAVALKLRKEIRFLQ